MLKTDFSTPFKRLPVAFQERVIAALKRLKAHAQGAVSSIYIYDLIDQNTLCCSDPSIPAYLGYSPQQLEALGEFGLATLIHPVDLQSVAAHFQRFSTLTMREMITVPYRMQRADQTWCWLRSHDTPLIQARDGFPLKILSLVEDISGLQNANFDHFSDEINRLEAELGRLTAELDCLSAEVEQLA
ncbi:MAG: PAS domain-containing protein [Leptolyngbya sp. RL_3_1]|nr:PAS domain-containing protein [Leptolyngbya sp. RL_3_1]